MIYCKYWLRVQKHFNKQNVYVNCRVKNEFHINYVIYSNGVKIFQIQFSRTNVDTQRFESANFFPSKCKYENRTNGTKIVKWSHDFIYRSFPICEWEKERQQNWARGDIIAAVLSMLMHIVRRHLHGCHKEKSENDITFTIYDLNTKTFRIPKLLCDTINTNR